MVFGGVAPNYGGLILAMCKNTRFLHGPGPARGRSHFGILADSTVKTMLQKSLILPLIGWFRGFFVGWRAGVDEEVGEGVRE